MISISAVSQPTKFQTISEESSPQQRLSSTSATTYEVSSSSESENEHETSNHNCSRGENNNNNNGSGSPRSIMSSSTNAKRCTNHTTTTLPLPHPTSSPPQTQTHQLQDSSDDYLPGTPPQAYLIENDLISDQNNSYLAAPLQPRTPLTSNSAKTGAPHQAQENAAIVDVEVLGTPFELNKNLAAYISAEQEQQEREKQLEDRIATLENSLAQVVGLLEQQLLERQQLGIVSNNTSSTQTITNVTSGGTESDSNVFGSSTTTDQNSITAGAGAPSSSSSALNPPSTPATTKSLPPAVEYRAYSPTYEEGLRREMSRQQKQVGKHRSNSLCKSPSMTSLSTMDENLHHQQQNDTTNNLTCDVVSLATIENVKFVIENSLLSSTSASQQASAAAAGRHCSFDDTTTIQSVARSITTPIDNITNKSNSCNLTANCREDNNTNKKNTIMGKPPLPSCTKNLKKGQHLSSLSDNASETLGSNNHNNKEKSSSSSTATTATAPFFHTSDGVSSVVSNNSRITLTKESTEVAGKKSNKNDTSTMSIAAAPQAVVEDENEDDENMSTFGFNSNNGKTILHYIMTEMLGEGQTQISASRSAASITPSETDKNMEEFLRVPFKLEILLFFGLAVCIDSFLYVITFLPLKFAWSMLRLFITLFIPNTSIMRFHRRHLYQILQVLIVYIVYQCILCQISIGVLYHWIRGQAMLKLYVLIAMVEIFDRLMCSFGQDAHESFYWNTVARPKTKRLFSSWCVVLVYSIVHSLILFVHVATLNVAMNSADQALLALLIGGNFAEIKSTVFKKYNNVTLFKIAMSDICERFKLALFFSLILLLNVSQGGVTWNVAQGYVYTCGLVVFSELMSDWIKHSFICKLNFIKSATYMEYSLVLARDVTGIGHEGVNLDHTHAVVKRMGLASMPLVCVMMRYLREAVRYFLIRSEEGGMLERFFCFFYRFLGGNGASSRARMASCFYSSFDSNSYNTVDGQVSYVDFSWALTVLVSSFSLYLVLLALKIIFGFMLQQFSRKKMFDAAMMEEEQSKNGMKNGVTNEKHSEKPKRQVI